MLQSKKHKVAEWFKTNKPKTNKQKNQTKTKQNTTHLNVAYRILTSDLKTYWEWRDEN